VIAKYELATNKSKFAGCVVRVAGHDFMDFRYSNLDLDGSPTSGGSDGCINFKDDDNTGLSECLQNSGIIDVYQSFCTTLSLADFLVIAAEAVMGRTATYYNSGDYYADGTFAKVLRDNFKFGRKTAKTCSWN
jgi:hypothetical protein